MSTKKSNKLFGEFKIKQLKQALLFFPSALVFFEIVTYLSNDMYLPSLPAIKRDLNISHDLSQYTLSLWFLGSASMQLFIGPLSDRYGRKIILMIGALCFVLASFICAFTSEIAWMFFGRFIQGCTVCCVIVGGYAAIHETYDNLTAIKIIALMGSIAVLAPAFGPLLGAIILEWSNWRMIFHFLGGMGLISFIWIGLVMPETRKHTVYINFSAILKDYIRIACRPRFLAYTLPFCFLFITSIAWIVESPFIIIETYQKSPLDFGIIQLLVFGSFMIGAQTTRILINERIIMKIIHYGLSIAMLSSGVLLLCMFMKKTELYYVVGSMMLISFGTSMAYGPLNRLAIDAGTEPMGRRVAIFSSYMSIFGLLSTLLVTFANDKTIQNLSIIIASGTLISFCLSYLLRRFR